ncbi:MAG: response regulator [Myxococcota bacterium]
MSQTASSGNSTTILIADDDPEILNMLNIRLSNSGYRVVTAEDGEAALRQAEDEQPRLVVLDVMMPKKTGWEVARALRQNNVTKNVKIVMLTAIGHHVNEMTSPLYGADAHLDKPFDFRKLEDVIAGLLS